MDKKSGKGAQMWADSCIKAGLPVKRLYTPVPTRFGSVVLMLKMLIDYKEAVNLCYSTNPDATLRDRAPTFAEWEVATQVCQLLDPVLKCCIQNQGRKYWLLSDAIKSIVDVFIDLQTAVDAHEDVRADSAFGNFEAELDVYLKRQAEAILACLQTHLNFLWRYDPSSEFYVFALLLDPRLASMFCFVKAVLDILY
jgi:hypothetical protein